MKVLVTTLIKTFHYRRFGSKSIIAIGNCLIVEDGWLSVHLLDRHLGVAHHHVAAGQQPPGNLGLGVAANQNMVSNSNLTLTEILFDLYRIEHRYLHNISKLDLFLAKLLLVFLKPRLVILDEQVNGVSWKKIIIMICLNYIEIERTE